MQGQRLLLLLRILHCRPATRWLFQLSPTTWRLVHFAAVPTLTPGSCGKVALFLLGDLDGCMVH